MLPQLARPQIEALHLHVESKFSHLSGISRLLATVVGWQHRG